MDQNSAPTDVPVWDGYDFDDVFNDFDEYLYNVEYENGENDENTIIFNFENSKNHIVNNMEEDINPNDSNLYGGKKKKSIRNKKQLTEKEHKRIDQRLNKFDPNNNISLNVLKKKFGTKLNHPELCQMAIFLSSFINVKVDRDAKRRRKVLMKWYTDNWDMICPFLDNIELYDRRKQLITGKENE